VAARWWRSISTERLGLRELLVIRPLSSRFPSIRFVTTGDGPRAGAASMEVWLCIAAHDSSPRFGPCQASAASGCAAQPIGRAAAVFHGRDRQRPGATAVESQRARPIGRADPCIASHCTALHRIAPHCAAAHRHAPPIGCAILSTADWLCPTEWRARPS
jgi:hypothetical protein